MLTREQARQFYDRFGAKQDAQWFYEGPAVAEALAHGGFAEAQSVFEFGCGTGHVAELLLDQYLPPTTTYLGCDLSPTMIGLARQRLARFGDRVTLRMTDGAPVLAQAATQQYDRFVSNYVVDLLAAEDVRALIAEAYRVLRPNGRMCLVSLTFGVSPISRSLMWLWQRLHAVRPQIVGGCRPLRLTQFLSVQPWRVAYDNTIVAYGIPSEIVVAEKY